MMPVNSNSSYAVVTNHEVSTVLSRLSSDEIVDIIQNIISNKYKYYPGMTVASNMVASYEYYCKNCKLTYPDQTNDIMEKRNETLGDIIDVLLKSHHLNWISPDCTEDIYSIAYYMYDFLVTNFNNYVIGFFIRYITRESSAIISMLEGMGVNTNTKKVKDLSTIYSKKIYDKDTDKMAIIHSYMALVVSNIINFDITLEQFIADAYAYHNIPHIGRFLLQFIDEDGFFFSEVIKPYVLIHLHALTTDIKLTAQSAFMGINNVDIASIILKTPQEEIEDE